MNLNIIALKAEIDSLLESTKRPGMENLIEYLMNQSDFFKAPSSTKFHSDYEGGLAHHSYLVYKLLKDKVEYHKLEIGEDTIIVCGLLHDLCKINFYAKEKKWRKDENNQWQEDLVWTVKDKFPIGHGEKSVIVAQKFMPLTDEESIAIRWHMVAFDAGIHFSYPSGFPFRQAAKENPLLTLLFTADFEASNIIETNEELLSKHSPFVTKGENN